MPLYKTITINPNTRLLIWKIEEPFEVLTKNVPLTDHCKARVDSMKSDLHRRGFLSVRHLLAHVGYTDFDFGITKSNKYSQNRLFTRGLTNQYSIEDDTYSFYASFSIKGFFTRKTSI